MPGSLVSIVTVAWPVKPADGVSVTPESNAPVMSDRSPRSAIAAVPFAP